MFVLVRRLIIAGLLAVPLASACRERRAEDVERPGGVLEKTAEVRRENVPPAKVPVRAGRGEEVDRGGDAESAAASVPERAEVREPQRESAREPGPTASAELKGDKTRGKATFRRSKNGRTRMTVAVRDAPKGRYRIGLLEGASCDAFMKMETPYAGGPGVAGESDLGGPDAKTTKAFWKSLAALDVGHGGRGEVDVELQGDQGAVFKRRVVVMASEGWKDKPKKESIVACGPLRRVEASEDRSGEG